MQKPIMQAELAIRYVSHDGRVIFMDATPDIVAGFSEFGTVNKTPDNHYALWVDARYDFAQVVAYLQSLSKPTNE